MLRVGEIDEQFRVGGGGIKSSKPSREGICFKNTGRVANNWKFKII